jgi:RNA methyltransferase, TrmH family
MITSTHNERLKELRKLQDRKHRERTGLFSAEGEDMLVEALRRGVHPKTVFYDPDELDPHGELLSGLPPGTELVPVQGETLRRSGTLGSGARLVGVWEQRSVNPASNPIAGLPAVGIFLYLHDVADPGNVGAVLRSALALVPSVVVLSPGTADPFGPKAVRAGMGAIFGQAVARATFAELRSEVAESKWIALAPRSGKPLREADLRPPLTICLGSERSGLPDEVLAGCDEICHVPLHPDGAESLNVAMAATLCLYELSLHKLSSSS